MSDEEPTRRTLLLGAGFSFDLGMPLAVEVTEIFLSMFNRRSARKFADFLSTHDPYGEGRPIDPAGIHAGVDLVLNYKREGGTNYEELLARLENLPWKSQPVKDAHHYLFSRFYDILYGILTDYQRHSFALLYPINSEHFAPLGNLLSKEETWVFSLNHDLYFESLAIDQSIPVTYGDTHQIEFPFSNVHPGRKVSFTYSERSDFSLDGPGWFRGRHGVNLVRLHGGFSELEYRDGSMLCNPSLRQASSAELMKEFETIEEMSFFHGGRRIPSGRDRIVTGPGGTLDVMRRALLTGGNKYSKTTNLKKGEEKLQLLENVLRQTEELTIIGYGFGDPHVNYRISNAMVLNNNLRLKIVEPARRPRPDFLEQFNYGVRLRGGQCGAAQWLRFAKSQTWDSPQIEALKKNERLRTEVREKVQQRYH